jgi:hypothetical protein
MLDDNVAQSSYATDVLRGRQAGRFHLDDATGDATPRLAPGAGLILALALLLGLWGLVWLAASTLIARWPW